MSLQFNITESFETIFRIVVPQFRSLAKKNPQSQILNCNSLIASLFVGEKNQSLCIHFQSQESICYGQIKTVNLMPPIKPVKKKNLKCIFTVVDIDPPRINKPFVKTQLILRISFFF